MTTTAKPELTPYEKFVAVTKQILSVSKEELGKRDAAWRKRRRAKKQRAA